jgi:hypothetical protein
LLALGAGDGRPSLLAASSGAPNLWDGRERERERERKREREREI